MKTHFFRIIIIILFSIIILNNGELKADNIEGKNWNNPADTWSGFVGLINKSDTEKRVASLAVYVTGGNGLSIDSASVTIDSTGLASYAQMQTLNTLVQNIKDTMGFSEYDSGYFVYTTVGTDSKPLRFVTTSRIKVYSGETYQTEFHYYNGTVAATGDDRDGKIYAVAYIKP